MSVSLRVLVIDDKELNQQSARRTLEGHEVTVVGTYDEAYKLFQKRHANWQSVNAECQRLGIKEPNPFGGSRTDEERREYRRIRKELCPKPQYDAVLSDLFMPASTRMVGERFVGQEMPVGFPLCLMAALYGAKYIAVVTARSHHYHPMTAALDPLQSGIAHEYNPVGQPPRFTINNAIVGFYGDSSPEGKDWGAVLNHLVSTPVSDEEEEGAYCD